MCLHLFWTPQRAAWGLWGWSAGLWKRFGAVFGRSQVLCRLSWADFGLLGCGFLNPPEGFLELLRSFLTHPLESYRGRLEALSLIFQWFYNGLAKFGIAPWGESDMFRPHRRAPLMSHHPTGQYRMGITKTCKTYNIQYVFLSVLCCKVVVSL